MQCQASLGIGDEGETIPGVEAGTRVRITAPVKVYHAPKQKVPWLLDHLLALPPHGGVVGHLYCCIIA